MLRGDNAEAGEAFALPERFGPLTTSPPAVPDYTTDVEGLAGGLTQGAWGAPGDEEPEAQRNRSEGRQEARHAPMLRAP